MTIREIAKLACVSPAAVSIVLNNKSGVSEETRSRIQKIVEDHGYKTGRDNKKKSKDTLLLKFVESGMLVEENQSFVSTIIDAIGSELSLHDRRLTMHIESNTLESAIKDVDFNNFNSAILIGTELQRELYGMLESIPIPYVVVDNSVMGVNCCSVTMDNASNVYIALEFLRTNGHSQIGYLKSAITTANFAERSNAFRAWVSALGFTRCENAEFVLTPTLVGAYNDMCAALQKGSQLPTCMFADNDTIALGAIKALKEYGYNVPEDVSVIGIDDIPFSSISTPALTTVRVQKEMIGKAAVAQLLALENNPEYQNIKTRIIGELVIRSSVSGVSGGRFS